MRYVLLVGLVVLGLAAPAEAGRRCQRSFQTLKSYHGWSNSCLQCHQPHGAKVQSGGWREAMGRVAYWKQENEAFNQALGQLLGATTGGGYGSAYGQVHTQYAPQGTTQYHYGALSSFGTLDIGALYDKSERLTAQAQVLAGQADADFKDLVQTAASGSARVAEILARGQAASAALAATAAGTPQPLTRTFSFSITQQPNGEMTVVPQPLAGGPAPITAPDIINGSCVKCHSGAEPKGGLDLSNLASLDDASFALTWKDVLARVKHTDPEKRMPRAPDGPGQPLSPEKIKVLEAVPH